MCIFTNDKDIPGHVRLSTRTLQYLIIPLLSLALLIVGQSVSCLKMSQNVSKLRKKKTISGYILVSIITVYSTLLSMGVYVAVYLV